MMGLGILSSDGVIDMSTPLPKTYKGKFHRGQPILY